MALTRPVTKTVISTTAFGIPVVDFVNANTPTAWTNVTFTNGWTAVTPVMYRKIGDNVQMKGRMASGTMSVAAFTLPAGFRPIQSMDLTCMSFTTGWGPGLGEMNTTGAFIPQSGGNTAFACNFIFPTT